MPHQLLLLFLFLLLTLLPICDGHEVQVESLKKLKLQLVQPGNYYTIDISIGKNKENENDTFTFNAQVDTTTSWTWVPSIELNYTNEIREKWDYNRSSTSLRTNTSIVLVDEDGDVSGKIFHDTLSIDNRIISLEQFAFVAIDKIDVFYSDYPQAKLGLGYRNEYTNSSFISMMKNMGIINKRVFTISEIEDNQIEVIFGGIPSKYNNYPYSKCSLVLTDDLDDEYRDGWVCELTHIIIGSENLNLNDGIEVKARVIFDSGYSYISIPSKFISIFKDNIINQYFTPEECWEKKDNINTIFECDFNPNKLNRLSLTFVIEGYGYVFSLRKLFKVTNENKYELLLRFKNENDNIWSFGYLFISQYAVVFDAEEKAIGFYGGEKEDFVSDWEFWLNHYENDEKHRRLLLMIVGFIFLGSIFLMVIIFTICKKCFKKKHWGNGSGSLMQHEQKH